MAKEKRYKMIEPHSRLWKPIVFLFGVFCLLHDPAIAQTGPCATVLPGKPLPDLIVDRNRLKADLLVSEETFDASSCAVVEGCVAKKGKRTLLRFSVSTPNIG